MTEEKEPSLAHWEAAKQLTAEEVTKPRTDSSAAGVITWKRKFLTLHADLERSGLISTTQRRCTVTNAENP